MVIVEAIVSEKTNQLYNSADIQNQREACVVLLHACMLEYGFIPKDVPEKEIFRAMPKKWKERELFKILYYHPYCDENVCSLTCIPLYNTLSVLGVVCESDCLESVNTKVDMAKYSKGTQNFSNILEVFQDIKSLCIEFKDAFCLPLLNLLCKIDGCNPLFGLSGLLSEIKVHILKFLPVEDILSLASVNKEFNSLTNQSQLWKFLFLRDFANDGVPVDPPSGSNWKQQYKKVYLTKKRKNGPRFHFYNIFPPPAIDTREELYRRIPPYLEYDDDVRQYFFPSSTYPIPPIFQRIPPMFMPSPPNLPMLPPFFRRLN